MGQGKRRKEKRAGASPLFKAWPLPEDQCSCKSVFLAEVEGEFFPVLKSIIPIHRPCGKVFTRLGVCRCPPRAENKGPLHQVTCVMYAAWLQQRVASVRERLDRIQQAQPTDGVKSVPHWIPVTKAALADSASIKTLIEDSLRSAIDNELDDLLLQGRSQWRAPGET